MTKRRIGASCYSRTGRDTLAAARLGPQREPSRIQGLAEAASGRLTGMVSTHVGESLVLSVQGRCGHAQEIIPLPLPDGRVTLVPVLGEAK